MRSDGRSTADRLLRVGLLLVSAVGFGAYLAFDPTWIAEAISSDGHLGPRTTLTFQVLRIAGGIDGLVALCTFVVELLRKPERPREGIASIMLAVVYALVLVPFAIISVLWVCR